ncbi:PEP/pyruvate-binding domain-containing protein [Candidatus Woesearchaeota archaeon]|nr:PEP/pyruvate-binding domain-containing protein [Candidatus Woesearchaeota archaeon]
MESDVLWFRDVEKGVFPLLGEKSQALSILYANEFPVPHGFIVPAKFYNKFLEKTKIKDNIKILMQNVRSDDQEAVQARANEIQRLIVQTEMTADLKNMIIDAYKALDVDKSKAMDIIQAKARDTLVAVRSDPVPGYRGRKDAKGLHMHFLNIKGEKMLVRIIQACWASLYTAKAVAFRASHGLSQEFCSMSVIVQRMVPARKSGILLTTNPTNHFSAVVKACLGTMQGHEGKQAPLSTYVVNTQMMDITHEDIKRQDTRFVYDEDESRYDEEDIRLLPVKKPLENPEAVELARLGKKIEELFNAPQEIEWLYYNKFHLIDSKPIAGPGPEAPERAMPAAGTAEAEEALKPETVLDVVVEGPGEEQPGHEISREIAVPEEETAMIEQRAGQAVQNAEMLANEIKEKMERHEPIYIEGEPAEQRHEEVTVYLDEKSDEIVVQDRIETGEGVEEKKAVLDPHDLLRESTKTAITSAIPMIHNALETAIRQKENDYDTDFSELLARQDYHNRHELELIKKLHDDFLAEKELSMADVQHALRTAEEFISYLKEHKLI